MVGNEHRRMAETQRLLDRLRTSYSKGVRTPARMCALYLRMCLKAEELRRQGWHAVVRGKTAPLGRRH
jgi:hypothetical protein